MSIRWKFILIFLLTSLFPLILAGGAGFYHIEEISKVAISESSKSIEKAYEQLVEQKTLDIKKSLEHFISMNMMTQENFDLQLLQFDPSFTSFGVQTFGKTGFTYLVYGDKDKYKYFLHPNPKLIDQDITSEISKNFKLKQILSLADKQGVMGGYVEEKGEKYYYVIAKIASSPLFVFSRVDYKEIESPINNLKYAFNEEKNKFLLQYHIGGIATGLIVILVALLFSIRLSRPITYLTEVAERISLGELETPIDITSTDEIGDLADALRRMQVSLRKAIQRLQRRSQRR
ncbi:MAG: hypothetical protein XD41_0914 [Desulfonauticus sp. 38_4375]|nr:MAG: hypothetical protein XD41_0914 [Desulfonauticus sp. 38_4375]